MGAENLKPVEALKDLDLRSGQAKDLAELQAILKELAEVSERHPNDFDVQSAVIDVEQHIEDRKAVLAAEAAKQQSSGPPTIPVGLKIPDSAGSGPPPTIESLPTTVPAGASGPPTLRSTPAPDRSPVQWQRALWIGVAVGVVASVIAIVVLVNLARKRNVSLSELSSSGIPVQVVTVPPGASVQVNGQDKCTSDCKMFLEPGNYQVTAFLDGYEPAALGVTVAAGRTETVNLTLEPRPQTVRILADLAQGKVTFDGQPAVDLQDGQLVLEKVSPGSHTVKVTGGNSEASLSFDMAVAKMPSVTGTVTTRNMLAVLVPSFGRDGRVVTSSGPWKLTVNGQAEADAGPAGVDLKNYQPGVSEIVLSQGSDQHSIKENFEAAPTLTVFLKSDLKIGTLIVSTNENGVRVFLNNREYPRKTQRGQLRLQTIGQVNVRVAKEGFENLPAQTVEVKKGSEARLEFKMKALPQLSTLQIQDATPGAEVLIDQRAAGTVGEDGSFRLGSVAPGDHTVTLRRERFSPKQFSRSFAAGQTVIISGADAVLVAERTASLPPPSPEIPKPAPAPKAAPAAPRPASMDGFDSPTAWREEGGVFRHRGEAFLSYRLPANGMFVFNVYMIRSGNLFRGGRLRWAADYTDARNYALFELDDQNLTVRDVVNGKSTERTKVRHNVESKDKVWAIQVDISPERVVHRIQKDRQWVTLDTWVQTGRDFSDGKFGFLVQGNDEIGVSDFQFTPR